MEKYESMYTLVKDMGYNSKDSEFKCLNCGNVFKSSIHELKRENRLGKHCPFCEISSKNSTKEHAEYKLKAANKPFEIIEFNGMSGDSLLLHRPCGKTVKTKIFRILSKTKTDGCIHCSHSSVAYTPEYVKEEISDLTDGEYTVISDYVREDIHIKVRHNVCGNEWDVIRRNFIYRDTRCPCCSRIEKKSKSAKLIENILSKNDIPFRSEVSYDDCKDKRTLPFDILIDNMNLLIEFDGEQHFHPWRFDDDEFFEKLKTTHNHDIIKDTFTTNNKMNLLRIPYTLSKKKIVYIINMVIESFKNTDKKLDDVFTDKFTKENLINYNNKNKDYYTDNGILPGVLKAL